MRRLVQKLEQRGVGGVCIEDKLFPKTNSFIGGEQQPLADVEEFAGKIAAGKDAQSDDNFCIVARVEAFIAGWGLEEALRRAEAYRQAGADAILMHSKKGDPSDIEAFMKEWGDRHPVVIVPTKYYSTPTDRFRDLGVSMVIWANHTLRSSIIAMQQTVKKIKKEQSLRNIEDKVASIDEVFRLQGDEELRQMEKKYLPKQGQLSKAIILAASRGDDSLDDMTASKPKTLIQVGGRTILQNLVQDLNEIGVRDVTVVRGYAKDKVAGQNFKTVDNDEYATTKDLYSLYLTRDELSGKSVILYGDSMFRSYVLQDMLKAEGEAVVVVDADVRRDGQKRDYARCNEPYTNDFFNKRIFLREIFSTNSPGDNDGEWVGAMMVNAKGLDKLKSLMDKLAQRHDFKQLTLVDMLSEYMKIGQVEVVYTRGGWVDVDTIMDLEEARDFEAD
jgi:phosphoenolpyruvate phosphomutase